MSDPLAPEGAQMDPNTVPAPAPQDRLQEIENLLAQPNGGAMLPTGTDSAEPPPQMDGLEERVWAEGYDPYAATKQEKSAWESATRKYTEIERWMTSGLNPLGTEGISPSAIAYNAADRFLTETGRTVLDTTNALGLTNEDTTKRVSYADAGPVEEAMSGILAYVASFAGYNKFLKTAGFTSNVVRWGTAGALTDAFGQDPFAEGFVDFLNKMEIPGLSNNFITDYFAAAGNEDDSVFEARFKNALEGVVAGQIIGKPVEWVAGGLWNVISKMKSAYQHAATGSEEAAQKALNEALEAADQLAKETGQPYFDSDKLEWDAGSYYASRNQDYTVNYTAPLDPKFQPTPEQMAEAAATPKAPRFSALKQEQANAAVQAADPTQPALKVAAVSQMSRQATKEFAENVFKDPMKSLDSFEKTFNVNRMATTEDVRMAIGQAADILRKEGIQIDHKITKDQIMELAEMYGEKPDVLTARLMQLETSMDHLPSIVVATRFMSVSLGHRIIKTAEHIGVLEKAGLPTNKLWDSYHADLSLLQSLIPPLKLVTHRAAVTPWTGNIVAVNTQVPEEILRTVKQFGGDKNVARLFISKMTPPKAVEAMQKVLAHKAWDALIQWRTGMLLYGPKTLLATNLVGTGLWTLAKPSFRVIGSMMMRDGTTLRESLHLFAGMAAARKGALSMARKAFVDADSIIDPGVTTSEARNAAFQALAEGKGDALQGFAYGVDQFSTFPMRILTTQDEFFKQISYRSFMYQKGMKKFEQGLADGMFNEADREAWVEQYVKDSFNPDGSYVDQEGIQYAREATFTQDLGPYGKAFQNVAEKVPPLKLVFPFIRTPTNILSEGLQMFPGANMLSKRYKELLRSEDPGKRAEAYGKLAAGVFFMGTAFSYAIEGRITGAMPVDPEMRRRFIESGRLPYAIYNEDAKRWVQYNRMDPFALPLGIAADMANAFLHEDDRTVSSAFAAAALGISDNIKNKSYFTGLADVMDLAGYGTYRDEQDKVDAFERALGKQVASLVPNFASQLNPDDTMRETRSIMDQVVNKLGFFGGSLPPKRDALGNPYMKNTGWIFGWEVPNFLSPLTASLPADSPIREDLYKAQLDLRPPPRREGNVSLEDFVNEKGQTAYDRYLELTSEVKDAMGRNVMEHLEQLLPKLKELKGDITPKRTIDGGDEAVSPIKEEINAVVGKYRKRALAQLYKEFPELKQAILLERRKTSRIKNMRAGSSAAQLLQ